MIIEYEGQSYPFDFGDITVKQAMKVEKHMGMTLTEWGDTLGPGEDGKPRPMNMRSLQAVGWLVLCGGEGAVDDADFKLGAFAEALGKAMADEAEAEAAAGKPVPTAAAPDSNGQTAADGAAIRLSSATASP